MYCSFGSFIKFKFFIKDSYFSIKEPAESLFVDKGSKFLAFAYPFKDISGLSDILSNLKQQHPKARHFCYAYRLGILGEVFKSTDDGEPAGTAGKPILNCLLSQDVSDVLIVVVRYFGGTLLGVPGLIRAYKTAAEDVLQAANKTLITKQIELEIRFEANRTNQVMLILKQFKIDNFTLSYTHLSMLSCALPLGQRTEVENAFQELWDVELVFDDAGFLGTGS